MPTPKSEIQNPKSKIAIGVPSEVKESEYRVGLVPAGVEVLRAHGHRVLVQSGAGLGTGITDEGYRTAGAMVVESAHQIWQDADLIVKVKEPQIEEYASVRPGQALFTYFHFAASRDLTEAMVQSAAVCIAYETIQSADGELPLLTPMSEVAGRMAVQEGAKYLERPMEGRGILLAGVPGVQPARVLILGAGIVGTNAAKIAAGLGAEVTAMDVDLRRLRHLDDILPRNVTTLYSNAFNIREKLKEADLVIGAVLRPGGRTPLLVKREMLGLMKPRAVIVDVAVDQGGCVETTHATTHQHPVYLVDGIVHYGVTNMPGAVAGTSTYALTNVTLPYVLQIAELGWRDAARQNPEIERGLNIVDGKIVNREVAGAFGWDAVPMDALLHE